MFKETEQGETQYCPMCEEWAEKYERLQKENEQLKNNIELMAKYNDENFDELLKCRKENEELKKEINLYKNSIVANHDRAIGKRFEEVLEENERLKEENSKIVWDEVCTTNCSKYKAYNKYRKALEEIREIAGVRFLSGINEEADAYNQDMSRIYNKINEVLK